MKLAISVVIPARNEEKNLMKCLASLKAQTFPQERFEVIVVDNNSTDRTAQIAEQAGVQIIHYDKLTNAGAVRQYGAGFTHAQIIAFLDADSIANKSWLSQINHVMQNSKIVCVGGSAWPVKNIGLIKLSFVTYDWVLLISQLFGKVLPWGLNMAVRKEAFDAVGGFDLRLTTCEDWDLALKLQEKYGKHAVVYVRGIQVYTSIRKYQNLFIFLQYFVNGIVNYVNFVFLKRKKATEALYVR